MVAFTPIIESSIEHQTIRSAIEDCRIFWKPITMHTIASIPRQADSSTGTMFFLLPIFETLSGWTNPSSIWPITRWVFVYFNSLLILLCFQLFREKNLIKSFDKGFHSFLPLLVRAYERLVRLIDRELQSIGCQKMIMPAIVSKALWLKSERWDQVGEEIFKLQDRHKEEYCLAPVCFSITPI